MNQPARIATAAAIHIGQMLASAFVLIAALETIHWTAMWWEARNAE
jgi:hypothetical protein